MLALEQVFKVQLCLQGSHSLSHLYCFPVKKTQTNQQATTFNMSCSPPFHGVSFCKGFMAKKSEVPSEAADPYTLST